MRGENRTDVESDHRALDVVGCAAHLAELPHRPAHRCRLEDARAFAQVRIPTPNAMGLFGGIDQQKEEGEGTRGHCALLDREAVDSAEQVLE
jgi:hypothetical protein